MTEKRRFPYAEAMAVALNLVRRLYADCQRIEIAGSLRRKKPEVGDIELVYVPKIVEVRDGLFDTKLVDRAAEKIENLVERDIIEKRKTVKGFYVWGDQNRLGVHKASGIPVDFFCTTERNYWLTLVIRTGPKAFNLRLIEHARNQNLKLHAYGVFESITTTEKIVPHTEREVFTLCGMNYLEPSQRR